MSQEEIIKFLLDKRLKGEEKFYTIKEIKTAMNDGKNSVHRCVNKLLIQGVIDLETTTDRDQQYGKKYKLIRELIWQRKFRINRKYMLQNKNQN